MAPVVVFNPVPGDQAYVLAPLAVRAVGVLQYDGLGGVMDMVGLGFTVMVILSHDAPHELHNVL